MTPEQFDQAAARTRLSSRSLDAARRVLVHGVGKTEAGRRMEPPMMPGQVRDAVARIERAFREMTGAPHGWACLTLVLPAYSEEWERCEEIARECRERYR